MGKISVPPPINQHSGGKIKIIVSGRLVITSDNPNVAVERKD